MAARLGIGLCAIFLGGCALFPLEEADCRGVDWERRGYADGLAGHPPQYVRLASECQRRFGAVVPMDLYDKGWRDGRFEWERLMGDKRTR
jgi:hypothetical protein